MEHSTGRPSTQIEVEAFNAITKLQDENRELKLRIQQLKAEIERLQQEIRYLEVDLEDKINDD